MVSAAERLFSPGPLLGMLAVLPVALVAGIKPGGNLPVLVVLLSFGGYVDPWVIAPVAVFYLAAVDVGEPVPSILLGIPGSRSAQATVLDGYPMARRGQAGIALGASYTCTLVGGLIGAIPTIGLVVLTAHSVSGCSNLKVLRRLTKCRTSLKTARSRAGNCWKVSCS